MLFRAATTLALTLLVAQGGGAKTTATAAPGPHAGSWNIDPWLDAGDPVRGTPLRPTARRNGGWQIDLPRAPGGVRYVTFPHGSLAGKRRIVMRYRIEAERGARIVPRTIPTLPSIITLYFQRAGDNWSARRKYETYRWYATFASHSPVVPGERVMVASLDGNWTAIGTSSARNNPRAFADAKADADQVGFVLGGGDGYGHGVHATGKARLIVTEFRVE